MDQSGQGYRGLWVISTWRNGAVEIAGKFYETHATFNYLNSFCHWNPELYIRSSIFVSPSAFLLWRSFYPNGFVDQSLWHLKKTCFFLNLTQVDWVNTYWASPLSYTHKSTTAMYMEPHEGDYSFYVWPFSFVCSVSYVYIFTYYQNSFFVMHVFLCFVI